MYVRLAADVGGPSLRSVGGQEDVLSLLPTSLVRDLLEWNARYGPIIPLEAHGRRDAIATIDELDAEGRGLAQRVADSLPTAAKVSYYSEGRLRLLCA